MVFILLMSQLVMDMGLVSYESKSTYFYMMLFFIEVQILRAKRKKLHEHTNNLDQGKAVHL